LTKSNRPDELLIQCGPHCDSSNLKRPEFQFDVIADRGRGATRNQLGSRRFNARDDCPYLCIGFDCGNSHRPLAADLNRLLLICTSIESGNMASLCVRRRSRQQPNSHFAGVDDHAPAHRRRACGFKLANDGVDTRALQSYLGHKSIQHTVRCTELAPTRFKGFGATNGRSAGWT
jgi:Phage integrase family